MRVLLLNPPYKALKHAGLGLSFPLGLGYLGTALKNAGIDVSALDGAAISPPVEIESGVLRYGLSSQELRQRIKDIKPDLVGIGCFFSSRFSAVLEAAQVVKSIDDKIITVTGGVHPSLMPKSVCAHSEIDFAVMGEGERSFVELIKAIINRENFDNIDGLTFKRSGKVIVNPKTSFIKDLDNLGFPAWELFDMERYLNLGERRWGLGKGRYAPMITSRSCPYRCIFCEIHSIMGPKYRSRSPDNVVDEIEVLVNRYKVNEISFEDDNLAFDKDRFVQICKGIVNRKIKIRWNTPNGVHVGSLDEDSLGWAKASGCDSLNLAIESGDDFIRNQVIRKGLKKEKIYEVVEFCHKIGIKPNAYFVIGIPGETESSIAKTRKYIEDLRLNNLSIFIATPIPGTRLFEECRDKGYLDSKSFEEDFTDYKAAIFSQPLIETKEFDKFKVRIWQHKLFIAYFKTTLADKFFWWLFTNPRAWVAMVIKIFLYTILGDILSFKITRKIRDVVKR